MNKQTYPIPEGCKAVTMEIIDNTIVTTFEPNEFKSGDILISRSGVVFIYRKVDGVYAYYYFMHDTDSIISNNFSNLCYVGCIADSRHATPEEAQRLWDALAKKGKRWNPETMQVEDIKKDLWRAEPGGCYYVPFNIGMYCEIIERNDSFDDFQHKNGFYCKTFDQSRRLLEKLKQAADKFWEEELK